jgi:hypothetical protein
MHNSKTTFVLVHGAWAQSILLATQRPINGQCIQEKAPPTTLEGQAGVVSRRRK